MINPIVARSGLALIGSVGGRLEPQLERAGGKLIRLHPPQILEFRNLPNLEILIASCDEFLPQVIHVHGIDQVQLGAALAAKTRLPLIVSCNKLPDRGSLSGYLKLRALSKAQRVISASAWFGDQIRKQMPKLTDRTITIAHGINIEAFDETAVTTARTISLAEVWGVIEDPRPIILVPVHADESSWPDHIFAIVNQTLHQVDGRLDAQFVLVGEDHGTGRTDRLEQKLLTSGLASHVRIVGHCADPEAALKLSSLVLKFSGKASSVCYTALQAQAMGRPVILGRSGAAAETIEDGVTGWLMSPDAPEHVAGIILSALAMDESARAHLALAARARVVSGNSTTVMTRQVLALYEDLARTGGGTIRQTIPLTSPP